MSKLLLVDGNALLHRAYYALPDWRNRSGEATAGVYGFLSMLFKEIEVYKPTHLVVVFDSPEPTFRHLMYVGYQTNREKERQVSEDIWGQVEKLKIVFEKMKVPVYFVPGFEADDVIGTIAGQATSYSSSPDGAFPPKLGGKFREESEVIIITGDRDLMQLVNEKVKLLMPLKGLSDTAIVDEAKVVERMGVRPDQIVDYKGLVGDSSDNYPGVTGIGPKTATHLLAEYGTLDEVYKNLAKLPDKLKLKLADGYESAKLSQKLATIRRDAPVTFEADICGVPSMETVTKVLGELGYKSLIKRVTGVETKIDENQTKLFE